MAIMDIFEHVDTILFDTLSIPLGFSSRDRAHMFVQPIGVMAPDPRGIGGYRPKLWTDTNMVLAGMLPAPCSFVIKSIRAALFNRLGELVPISSRYYRAACVDLRIAMKTYYQAPLWRLADPAAVLAPGCGGVANFLTTFDKEERTELIRALRLQFDKPPLIDVQMPFEVELKFDEDIVDWHRIDAPGTLNRTRFLGWCHV